MSKSKETESDEQTDNCNDWRASTTTPGQLGGTGSTRALDSRSTSTTRARCGQLSMRGE